MTRRASGAFDVKMQPQPPYNSDAAARCSRFALDKAYRGDLEATSKGEMLAVGTAVDGSAGYVAIERVSGSLHGRPGSFALQHTGTMHRGAPSLAIAVVPDSGDGSLEGIAGTMEIVIEGRDHLYHFDYELGDD